jgi:hypothetical protein
MSASGARGGKASAHAPLGVVAVAVVGALGMAVVAARAPEDDVAVAGASGAPAAAPAAPVTNIAPAAPDDRPPPSPAPPARDDRQVDARPNTPARPSPPPAPAPSAAGRPGSGAQIVVKFRDGPAVKEIVDLYWKDQAAARARFERFRAGRDDLAGLTLERVTYSNELVLRAESAPGEAVKTMRALAAKLGASPDISYAEPDLTAQPGDQR